MLAGALLLVVPAVGAPADANDPGMRPTRAETATTGVIHGYVRDTTGAPITTGEIMVFAHRDGAYQLIDQAWLERGTEPGQYRIGGLLPDVYHVCFYSFTPRLVSECFDNVDYSEPSTSRTAVVLAAGQSRRMDFYIQRRASISGTVSGPADALDGVRACATRTPETSSLPNRSRCDWPGPDGTYTIIGVDRGEWWVCFQGGGIMSECWDDVLTGPFDPTPPDPDPATVIAVPDGTPITGIDADLERAASVTATVSGITALLRLTLYREVGGGWQPYTYAGAWWFEGRTQTIPLVGLPAGTYRLCAWQAEIEDDPGDLPSPPVDFAPECHGGPTLATATDIVVGRGEQVSGPGIALGAPATLGGVVSGVDRRVLVTLLLPDGRPVTTTRTTARGVYRFDSLGHPFFYDFLPGGDYRLAFDRTFARSPYAPEFYRNVTEERGLAASQVIPVPPGSDVDAFNSLATGGAIRGRLLDRNGDPPAGVCQVRVDAPGLTSRYTLTAPDGSFEVGGLTTGEYVVQIRLGKCSVAAATSLFVSTDAPGHLVTRFRFADPVAVTRGSVTTLPFDLVAP